MNGVNLLILSSTFRGKLTAWISSEFFDPIIYNFKDANAENLLNSKRQDH